MFIQYIIIFSTLFLFHQMNNSIIKQLISINIDVLNIRIRKISKGKMRIQMFEKKKIYVYINQEK